jgi:hypothetical protein
MKGEKIMNTYNSIQDLAKAKGQVVYGDPGFKAGTCNANTRKTLNMPHIQFADGTGAMDFHMESYAGNDEDRFPGVPPVKGKNGESFTLEDKAVFYNKHARSNSPNAFYGEKDGKVYQYNPETGQIDVGKVGEVQGYGDKLPDGWQNYVKS